MLKTDDGYVLQVREYSWGEIRDEVAQKYPKLAILIDDLRMKNKYVFTELHYPFGVDIIKDGKMRYSLGGPNMIWTNDTTIPKQLRTDYPVILTLEKKFELYTPMGDRIISDRVISPGGVIGVPRVLNGNDVTPISYYDLSSGIRNLFAGMSVHDKKHWGYVQNEYGVLTPAPKNFKDQQPVYTKIIHKADLSWASRALLIPPELVIHLIEKEPAFAEILNHLTQLHRASYGIEHKETDAWDIVFGQVSARFGLESGYNDVLDLLKQICAIGANSTTGFTTSRDEAYGPMQFIESLLTNCYRVNELTGSAATLIVASQIDSHNLSSYYSCHYPTALQHSTSSKRTRTLLALFMRTLNQCIEHIHDTNAGIRAKTLVKTLLNTEFKSYHCKPGKIAGITNSKELPNEDERFRSDVGKFPAHSLFFNGIIKITPK